MVTLWLTLLRMEAFREYYSDTVRLDLGMWLMAVAFGILSGILVALVFVVPFRGGYRWGSVLVAAVPPLILHAHFIFFYWWSFPRGWNGPRILLRFYRLTSPTALLPLAVIIGVAIGLGFLGRGRHSPDGGERASRSDDLRLDQPSTGT